MQMSFSHLYYHQIFIQNQFDIGPVLAISPLYSIFSSLLRNILQINDLNYYTYFAKASFLELYYQGHVFFKMETEL